MFIQIGLLLFICGVAYAGHYVDEQWDDLNEN